MACLEMQKNMQRAGQPGLEICPGKEAAAENPEAKIGSWAPIAFGQNEWTRIDPLAGGIVCISTATVPAVM